MQLPRLGFTIGSAIVNFFSIRRTSADVYHITGDVHYIAMALPKRKTILTIHDCVFMYQTSGVKRKILYYFFLKWPVAASRFVTTISEHSKQDIMRFTGCSSDKVIVIPNPVDNSILYTAKQIDNKHPRLLFIGSTPNKNLNRVIEAIQGIPCHLRIVGMLTEEHKAILEKYEVKYDSAANLNDNELSAEYTDCDMVIFPSTFEGFGLPILEGQKAGRPVLTSNLSPMKEVAGDAACLVDPYDVESIRKGIQRIIQDDTYRAGLVGKGIENIQRFHPRVIAMQYFDLYQKIMAQ